VKNRTLRRPVLTFLILILTVGCVFKTTPTRPELPSTPPTSPVEISMEESEEMARSYLLNSPTFKFDGMEESVELVETDTLRCPYCWEFVYEFSCRHAGYGDRKGKMLAQVITPHRAKIVVQEGKIENATIDDRWDMVEQEPL